MGIFDFLFRRPTTAPVAAASGLDPFAARRAQRDLQWRRLLQNLDHPYEVVSSAQAQAAFEAAQVLGRTEGFSPLIIQPGFDGRILNEPLNLKDSKVRMTSEYFARRADEFAQDASDLTLFDSVDEVMPKDTPQQLYIVDGLSGARPASPYAELAILRLPCAISWKIPLFVDFGEPFDQSGKTRGEELAIEKDWYERFGAELCCVGDRSWQFRVTRPPRDHREAVELLREHYLYSWVDGAYDKETIENSVASLRVATYWIFVWT